MIIDTSALVAVLNEEDGSDDLFAAFASGMGLIPAPVIVEYERVTSLKGNRVDPKARALLDILQSFGVKIIAFDVPAAAAAAAANSRYGSGNGRGSPLNMLDLMVYGVARTMVLPILCTGRDFAATDAAIHPASRIG